MSGNQLRIEDVRLQVTPNPALRAGTNEFEVTLTLQDPDGELVPEVHVPVVCPVVYDVEAVPRQASFGVCHVGETFAATVTLRSRTGKTFMVDEVIAPRDEVVVSELSENGTTDAKLFRVTGVAANTGSQIEHIRFVVSQKHESEPFELRAYPNTDAVIGTCRAN